MSKKVAAFLLAVLSFGIVEADSAERPNILFISIDDLRPELGCYGVVDIKSPNIDRIAASGTTFTRAYCQQAVCNPSRASIMTGLRPDSTKVWDLVTDFRDAVPDVVTLPQHFRKHGYYAAAYGKIYHNPLPDEKSWDEPNHWPEKATAWSQDSRRRLAEVRQRMREKGANENAIQRLRPPATDEEDVPDSQRPDGEITDQAIAALQTLSEKKQPFFLAVGFIRPHLPFTPPKKYWDLYQRDEIPLANHPALPDGAPAMAMNTMYELRDYVDFASSPRPTRGSLTKDEQRRLKHGYYASVSFVDAQVGRLLDQLDELKLRDNTIVVVWGDHGWKLGEHNSWCKQTNYEIDVRVPLVIRDPRKEGAGEKCDSLVELLDVYPTLSELAGLPLPDHLQGHSAAKLLDDPDQPFKAAACSQFLRRFDDGEFMGYAMRTDRYRYVEWLNRHTGDVFARELYDHDVDPAESKNIADLPKNKALVERLNEQLWTTLEKPQPRKNARQQSRDQRSDKPNILVLMGDDWSWPHFGAAGDRTVKTPTFDRLARDGVMFDHAFVSSPSCTPSRVSIAAGQWHWRLGEAADLGGSLAKDVPVYPELLEAAGYRIGFSRKGAAPSQHVYRKRDPFGPRFDSFDAFLKDREDDRPFCFWYGAGEPHRPYRFGNGQRQGLDPEKVEVPDFLPDNETTRSDMCDYFEAIQRFDEHAAKMIAKLEAIGELDNTVIVLSGDNGMPFPRAKATLYDSGTRVPLVIHWPKMFPGNRQLRDVVNLTDLAPTILQAAGLPIPKQMTGRSLLTTLKSAKEGQVDPARTSTLTGMERHVYDHPCRALRTHDFLYIHNFQPEDWSTGERDKSPRIDFTDGSWPNYPGAFSFNIDPSPTMQYLLDHRDDEGVKRLFELACGRRPAEELYDLESDPHQLRNVADDEKYATTVAKLREQLSDELRQSCDPRSKGEPATEARKPPNVLLIIVDDLNDWIGCLGGHPQSRTPNIDRLADSGMLFTNAYCAGASCNPSRTALMTGIAPYNSGLYTNRQPMRKVLPDAEIMPKYFSRHGYHSTGAGKILHYFVDGPSWDAYFPDKNKENPFPRTLYPEMRPVSLPWAGEWQYRETDWGPLDVTDEEFGGDWLVSKFVGEELRKKHDEPFFLACGIYRPHEPWFVPKKYFDMFPIADVKMPLGLKEDDLDDLPPLGQALGRNRYLDHIKKHDQWKQGVQGYLASIAFADAMVGRVIKALDEGPNRDNTIVVLCSDHGWHLGEKEHWQKFTGWRVCARVPLIVRVPQGVTALPEGTKAGQRCHRPVNLLDIFPTLTQLCGISAKEGNDGHNLLPLLKDPQAKWSHASLTHLDLPGNYAISQERWRYIHYFRGGEELYDIETDPHEWTNLASDPKQAERLTEFRKLAPAKMTPLVRPSSE